MLAYGTTYVSNNKHYQQQYVKYMYEAIALYLCSLLAESRM